MGVVGWEQALAYMPQRLLSSYPELHNGPATLFWVIFSIFRSNCPWRRWPNRQSAGNGSEPPERAHGRGYRRPGRFLAERSGINRPRRRRLHSLGDGHLHRADLHHKWTIRRYGEIGSNYPLREFYSGRILYLRRGGFSRLSGLSQRTGERATGPSCLNRIGGKGSSSTGGIASTYPTRGEGTRHRTPGPVR